MTYVALVQEFMSKLPLNPRLRPLSLCLNIVNMDDGILIAKCFFLPYFHFTHTLYNIFKLNALK